MKAALAGSAGLCLSRAGFALAADTSLTTSVLSDGVTLISGAGANIVVASGPGGRGWVVALGGLFETELIIQKGTDEISIILLIV